MLVGCLHYFAIECQQYNRRVVMRDGVNNRLKLDALGDFVPGVDPISFDELADGFRSIFGQDRCFGAKAVEWTRNVIQLLAQINRMPILHYRPER